MSPGAARLAEAGAAARPLPFIINASAGGGCDSAASEALRREIAASGIDAEIQCVSADAVVATVRRAVAAGATRVAVGGGDGTIGSVAAELADSGVALGVLPLGTLNHFVHDAGIPSDRERALRTIAAGHCIDVDLGEVNGRVFVNNCSLGLYPAMVRDRERQRRRLGRGKWFAALSASLAVLRRHPFLAVRIKAEGIEAVLRTPQVFIGNNRYETDGWNVGERPRLDQAALSIYVVRCGSRVGLWLLALRALFARLRPARDFEMREAPELVVESRHARLQVALDGELTTLATPLECRIRPRALRLIAPAPA